METYLQNITEQIMNDPENESFTNRGIKPLFTWSPDSRVIVIGQAPGIRAETSGMPWDDPSGERLREWMGISNADFYNPAKIALIPMDFYYPGTGKTGDLAPRKGFAEKWHSQLLERFEEKPLIILIGMYAQNYYLQDKEKTLTATVKNYKKHLADNLFPLPHPSPRNNIWLKKNGWFKEDVLPQLQKEIQKRIKK